MGQMRAVTSARSQRGKKPTEALSPFPLHSSTALRSSSAAWNPPALPRKLGFAQEQLLFVPSSPAYLFPFSQVQAPQPPVRSSARITPKGQSPG